MAVEEQEIDEDGNVISRTPSKRRPIKITEERSTASSGQACIRDSSRNRLQRLGALYSDSENLSSPIHRTEPNFVVEPNEREPKTNGAVTKGKTRFNKLTELAQSINTWEDDLTHSSHKVNENIAPTTSNGSPAAAARSNEPKIVNMHARNAKSPRKPDENANSYGNRDNQAVANKTEGTTKNNKQLKWDKSVMDALESQGFKRRDTTTSRLEYEFKDAEKQKPSVSTSMARQQLNVGRERSTTATATKTTTTGPSQSVKNDVTVTKGLVSGRTAIFEKSERTQGMGGAGSGAVPKQNQKDPAEMSLKERLALFEKNKGSALIPKAALGMAPSAKQIMPTEKPHHACVKPVITTPQQPMIGSSSSSATTSMPSTKVNNFNKPLMADSNASGSGIRQTVAALLSNTATISESQIAQEVRKTREQEMNILLNRFNQNATANVERDPEPERPIPTAPPMPKTNYGTTKANHKRRSDEKLDVSPSVRDCVEDVKRVRVNPPKSGYIYPALSDIESVTESDKCKSSETYTEDDDDDDGDYNESERKLMNQYLYSSQDENDDDNDDEQR